MVGHEDLLVVVDSTFRFAGGDTSPLELAVLFMVRQTVNLETTYEVILLLEQLATVHID